MWVDSLVLSVVTSVVSSIGLFFSCRVVLIVCSRSQELPLFEYSIFALLRLIEPKQLVRLLSAVLLERQIILSSIGYCSYFV